jgi:hypothetical protein
MAKKRLSGEEDFQEEDLNIEDVDSDETIVDSEISYEDDLDIVIEIDEDDLIEIETPIKDENDDSIDDIILSKHQIEGKHSLKYDSIFKGKKEDPIGELDSDGFALYYKETIEVDKSSVYHTESIDNEAYIRSKEVKEKIYDILSEKTDINFLNNRRKPSKLDFNDYYALLKRELEGENFTNCEIFSELAVYFSDNMLNMFKLLDPNWRNLIISELQDHIGKNVNSKEISNRNIYEGTEVEFIYHDQMFGNDMLITGVVLETDYEDSKFKVDSFEKIYWVKISEITKILNNTKFKYNLNKLNNIDFL